MIIYKIEKIEGEYIQIDYFGMINDIVICTGVLECGLRYKQIYSLFTSKEYRGKGYGTQMIEHIINEANGEVWLSVLKDNTTAIKLYEKLGFIKQYDKDNDKIWMKK